MSRSRPALKRLGKEFTKGYCEMAEGEKDPRNLMMSFGIIRVILVEFDLDDCVDVSSVIVFDVREISTDEDDSIGLVRCDILLLPDYVHAASGRPVWNHQ